MDFAKTLKKFRLKAGKSKYRLAQYTGLTEPYILRLETGQRSNPTRDVVLMLGLALVENSRAIDIYDVDELLLAAGFAPLHRRREAGIAS